MAESTELFNEVALIRDQIDDMSRSVAALTRNSGIKDSILAAMDAEPILAHIFMAVDGTRTQTEIVAALKTAGQSASAATVSRKIEVLVEDHDLIRPTGRSARGISYVHTSLAKDLGIARSLQKKISSAQSKQS